MLKGFREFIMRGNVVDLAVAVVIGAAFALVIKSVLDGLINPLIAAIFGKPNLVSIGIVLTALINFLAVAAAIYFIVIVPMNMITERARRNKVEEVEAEKSDE